VTSGAPASLPDAEKDAIAAELRRVVWPLLDCGRVKPVIHSILPLDAAAETHRTMEAGAACRQDHAAAAPASGPPRLTCCSRRTRATP